LHALDVWFTRGDAILSGMVRIAVNGFGRIGRLALRVVLERPELGLVPVAVNDPGADAATFALLLEFDSVHGRFERSCRADGDALVVGEQRLAFTRTSEPASLPWRAREVDTVLECSGRFKSVAALAPQLVAGARRVVVSAPIEGDAPNVVIGVNHDAFDLRAASVLGAASCTTNCLAPLVRVVHDALGIERGLVTTIHDPTNSQNVVDAADKDPRRARSALVNLVPTSTNSAHAVTRCIPELAGKLDSIAVRAPVLNASLVDAVFQVARDTSVAEVDALLASAAASPRYAGILGYESRPLVSSDYAHDPRSGIVDAPSTRVTDRRLVKVLAWYDNEWAYANRLVELAAMACGTLQRP
jgi:glyceraldehyde 3-phosphate dehydrogenase